MRTANEKEKASELIEKLLSNVTNFEEAIELVLDDSSLSFKLLKIILNIAQNLKNSGSVDISDLINRKYRDESMVRNIWGFFSSCSLKMREKYISFAQFVYFLRELRFNFGMMNVLFVGWSKC